MCIYRNNLGLLKHYDANHLPVTVNPSLPLSPWHRSCLHLSMPGQGPTGTYTHPFPEAKKGRHSILHTVVFIGWGRINSNFHHPVSSFFSTGYTSSLALTRLIILAFFWPSIVPQVLNRFPHPKECDFHLLQCLSFVQNRRLGTNVISSQDRKDIGQWQRNLMSTYLFGLLFSLYNDPLASSYSFHSIARFLDKKADDEPSIDDIHHQQPRWRVTELYVELGSQLELCLDRHKESFRKSKCGEAFPLYYVCSLIRLRDFPFISSTSWQVEGTVKGVLDNIFL